MLPARLSDRLRLLRWAMPAMIAVVAALYQLGPARYVHDNYGGWSHLSAVSFWLTLVLVVAIDAGVQDRDPARLGVDSR